jgi:hypothetical protein
MVMFADGFQNHEGAQSVVLQKDIWVSDASVNMGFRGYVHYGVYLVNQAVHKLGVTYVAFDESVLFVVFNVMEVSWVCTYSDFVNVD